MLFTGVDLQFFKLLPPQFIFWQHSLHGMFDNRFRFFFQELTCRYRLNTTRVTTVPMIHFIIELIPGQMDLLGIYNNNKVTRIHMGSKRGLCLPLSIVAICVASLPRTLFSASTIYHVLSISFFFALIVAIITSKNSNFLNYYITVNLSTTLLFFIVFLGTPFLRGTAEGVVTHWEMHV